MAHAEITYSGTGTYTAFILDSEGREVERFRGSLAEVCSWLEQHFPGLPARFLPLRNPAARIEWTGAGAGRYLAVVIDEHGRIIAEFWGTLAEVKEWMQTDWPQLPATFEPMIRNPRSREQPGRKESAVSDRALRYRANATPPPGPRICAWCGSMRGIEIAHISGDESDGSQANLGWVCRSCNVFCANALRRVGLGRATVQFNPASRGAESLGQWVAAVTSMKGQSNVMTVPAAVEMIRATDPEARSGFAREIWRKRRQHYGPSGRPGAVPF